MKSIKLVRVLFVMVILMGSLSPSAFARQYSPSTGRFTKRDPIQYAENVGKNQVDLYTYATRPQGVRPQPSLYRPSLLVPDVEGFIMREPIGYEDGINLYSYVGNNPANRIDALGLCPSEHGNKYNKMVEGIFCEYNIPVGFGLWGFAAISDMWRGQLCYYNCERGGCDLLGITPIWWAWYCSFDCKLVKSMSTEKCPESYLFYDTLYVPWWTKLPKQSTVDIINGERKINHYNKY